MIFINMELNEIISECINRYILTETNISTVYHYISGCNLISLLSHNSMYTSNPEFYYKDGKKTYINGIDQRFISFTRNKNAKEGYPVLKYGEFGDGEMHYVIRLEIDSSYLCNHNLKRFDKRYKSGYESVGVKLSPIDWAYYDYAQGGNPSCMADSTNGIFASNGKEWQMQSDEDNYYNPIKGNVSDKYNHPMSQAEERLTSRSKYIPEANRYIKRIDIYYGINIDDKEAIELKEINRLAQKRGIPIYMYNDFNRFNYQR